MVVKSLFNRGGSEKDFVVFSLENILIKFDKTGSRLRISSLDKAKNVFNPFAFRINLALPTGNRLNEIGIPGCSRIIFFSIPKRSKVAL